MEHEITDTKLLVTDSLYQNYQYLRLRISSVPISRALKSALVAQQNRKKKKKNGALKKTQARDFTAIGLVEGIPYRPLPRPAEKVHRSLQNLLFF